MINKINTSLIQDIMSKPSTKKKDTPASISKSDSDVSIQVQYAELIARAMDSPRTEEQAVEKAKALLESGQLDSTEYIKQAALDIQQFGW